MMAGWVMYSDEDKHKTPTSTRPRPLSLQIGPAQAFPYYPTRLSKIIRDAIMNVSKLLGVSLAVILSAAKDL